MSSIPLASVDAYNRWCKIFTNKVSLDIFTNCFMKLYKITNSTKLRDFQYRLLHKKIPSNLELHKWGVKKNDRCELCSEQDSIQHLLYYCDHVIDIWQQWIAEVHDNFNIKIDLTFEMIVLNTFTNRPGSLINLMGLVGASPCHDSLIFMSTHKATAARCLSHHQATYGLPPSAWPL